MILLQPLLLVLAALTGAALILAVYLRRRKAPPLYFSAVRFLPQNARPHRVRSAVPPLHILVPLLVLTLIALSLAQPVLSQTQGTPVGLILDERALASQETTGLRQVALAIARETSLSSHWGAFTTSGQVVASGIGKDSLTALLQSYSLDTVRASYSPSVFQQAVSFLREQAGAAPVLILVGNAETFSRYPGLSTIRSELGKEGVRLLSVSRQGSDRKAFIAATVLPQLARLGSETRARVGLANTGGESLNGELRLLSGSNVVVRAAVRLPAESLSWQELKISPDKSGLNRYEIILSVGGSEDRASWEVAAFGAQKVLIIAPSGSAGAGYAEKAVKSSPLVAAATVAEPEALDMTKLRQFLSESKVAVLDGLEASQLPAELGVALRSWVESGGVLVFTYGAKVTEAWNNHPLSSILPAPLLVKKDKLLQGVTVKEHPLTANLELESAPLTVSQWLPVKNPPPDSVLVSVGGEPMLLTRQVKQGTVLFWASSLEPRWNNWALHPSFPVFWSNVVVYSLSREAQLVAVPEGGRSLWRAAVASSGEKIFYLNDEEDGALSLPPALEKELGRPVKAYREYRLLFLALGLSLALGYLWWVSRSRRRAVG